MLTGADNDLVPATFFKGLTARHRTQRSNRQLGGVLAFVAGAVNAGGFLAVQRYTSHMTGIISAVADEFVLGNFRLALGALAMAGSFLAGTIITTLLIHWARRRTLDGEFALPLMLEGALLLAFGLLGANLLVFSGLLVPATVILLCFIMGLQNAVITKISRSEIRTTHMTGVLTDIGIGLGRLMYHRGARTEADAQRMDADSGKLRIHAALLGLFITGAVVGAYAFRKMGFSATVPLAALLMALATPSLMLDMKRLATRKRA